MPNAFIFSPIVRKAGTLASVLIHISARCSASGFVNMSFRLCNYSRSVTTPSDVFACRFRLTTPSGLNLENFIHVQMHRNLALLDKLLLAKEMMLLELALALVFGFVLLCCGVLRWNEVRYMKKGLPLGTIGWPLFGETTEFLKQGPNFMKNQRARYGNFFKSHILGCSTAVCIDPEINKYILMNESKGLVPKECIGLVV